MSTERYKFENASGNHIADKITADINVTGKFATNRVFGHGDTCEIIFVNMCRGSLSISEVTEDLAHVINLMSALTSRNIFGFRCGERHAVLTARLPRHSASVEHNNVTCMGTARIHVGCPI
jgi:hypothetical protein